MAIISIFSLSKGGMLVGVGLFCIVFTIHYIKASSCDFVSKEEDNGQDNSK